MANFWNGQRFDTDWFPIDDQGNRTGDKDWNANRSWNEQNAPDQVNNFSPDVLAQTGGIKPSRAGAQNPLWGAWETPQADTTMATLGNPAAPQPSLMPPLPAQPSVPTYTAPTLQLPTPYVAPTLGTAETFTGPTAETLVTDPGYQFRLKQGLQALENSAAAKGMVRTGAAQKGLIDYAGDAASQEFTNAYGRARDTFDANQGSKLATFDRNAAAGKDAYDRSMDAAMSDFASQFQGSQAELAPKMEAWRAQLAQDEAERQRLFQGTQNQRDDAYRTMVFKSDDNFRRSVYGNEDAYKRYRDTIEDDWKRKVMDEERHKFLVTMGAA